MITRLTPKVLNSDSAETLLKPTEMMDAINIQLSGKDESDSGIVKHSKGNAVVALSESIAQYSEGKNTVIGTVSDENLGVIFFFVHNDAGNHGIYAYSTKTNTHRLIFKGSILNFEENGFVKGDLVRIKRKSQDEEFTIVNPDTDFPGGGPIFETEEIVTVSKLFYYERDFSLLAETAKICLANQLGEDAEPDTWDGTNVPIGIRATIEISNDTPGLGVFYPEAGDILSGANAEAFNNPSDHNTLDFNLSNTVGETSTNPDLQQQFLEYSEIEDAVRSWIRNGAFQVNMHPDAITDPDTSIKVTLRVLNTVTEDLELSAIQSFSSGDETGGTNTVWPTGDLNPDQRRPPPTNIFTYTGADLLPALIGDIDANQDRPKAFGHDTISEEVRVIDAFYSAQPSVGGDIISGLTSTGISHIFGDAGSAYHDTASLVYSASDGSTLMGNRIVKARITIDFSQTQEWAEYRQAWQTVYDSQQPDQEDDPAFRSSGQRDPACEGFPQPSCLGWSDGTQNYTNPFEGFQAALDEANFLNQTFGCSITVISPFPCSGNTQLDIPSFNPAFVMVSNQTLSVHTPINEQGDPEVTTLPDLEASLNGTADNVPDPAIYATGVYDFLIPVQVSGPGYLYRSNFGFAVKDSSAFGANPSLADIVNAGPEYFQDVSGEMFLSAMTEGGPQIINKASTSVEGVSFQQGGSSITWYPRPFVARGVFIDSDSNDVVVGKSIAESVYNDITENDDTLANWLAGASSGSEYQNFTDVVFPYYTLNFTRGYTNTEAENDEVLEDKKDFCFNSFDSCEGSNRGVVETLADTESVVSETSTREEREPSAEDDSPQQRQADPENTQPTTAQQAAQRSKTKTTKGY